MSETLSPYVGWLKPEGGEWQRVCDGATEAECWRKLILIRPGHIPHCEKTVNRGAHPDARKKPR